MDLKENAWIWTLALLLIGGVAFFAVSDVLHPPLLPSLSQSGANQSLQSAIYPLEPNWSAYEGVINGPNGDNLSAADLRGRVVLVDFWTYSCINCIRTLPYIEAWQQRYGPQGFVVVEVHSPEFEFEKSRANVQAAVNQYNLTTITVLDGEHRIWDEFGNAYWPHMYLIDGNGYIRYDHIGEGAYDQTESEIRSLLMEQNKTVSMPSAQPVALTPIDIVDFTQVGTPELYFGSASGRQAIANSPLEIISGQPTLFTLPTALTPNLIYLNGTWTDEGESMRLVSGEGDIAIIYHAKDLHLVADLTNGNASAQVYLDGQVYSGPEADANGTVSIGSSRLYSLVLTSGYETHTARIHITGAGFRAYSFTFG